MFRIGDQVIYSSHGVCNIVDLECRLIDGKEVIYLVLSPTGQGNGRFLVPAGNPKAMSKVKPLLSKPELEALLNSEEVRQYPWIREDNLRKQKYRELIGSCDRENLAAMVYALYRHREQQTAAGKKCHLCDENFLRDAEKLLISEISVVMDMEPDDAKQYLRQRLK